MESIDWFDQLEICTNIKYYLLLYKRKDNGYKENCIKTNKTIKNHSILVPIIPRLSLSHLKWKNRDLFLTLMEKHSFIILTDLGNYINNKIKEMNRCLENFFIHCTNEEKLKCCSNIIYYNEKNIPMWFNGYEKTNIREAFRTFSLEKESNIWPNIQFYIIWKKVTSFIKKICDQCLSLTLNYDIHDFIKEGKDFSVCYGLYYSNKNSDIINNVKTITGQSKDENVFEHVDPSLFVIEPISNEVGLEVYDLYSKKWISVEKNCHYEKEFVLFCGKGIEKLTNNKIKGTLHRVKKAKNKRICLIYEQKYDKFM